MEVIARLDRAVHVGDIDAVSLWFRRILCGGSEKTEGDNSNKFKGGIKEFLGGSHLQHSTGHLPGRAGPHSRRKTKQEGSTTAGSGVWTYSTSCLAVYPSRATI